MANAIVGLSLLGLAACLELSCLFVIRILLHKRRAGHISTIRVWLHISAAIEQISYIIFHLKYHFLSTDFKIQKTCIVLRFTTALTSTMTNSWIFVIASFYLMLTIKPSKCSTFHSRFLSHCITWTWTFVSCLIYLMLSFLLKKEYHLWFIYSCWNNISSTIHMYIAYGNEIIPLVLALIILSFARWRVPIRRELLRCFIQHSENDIDVETVRNAINRFLILGACILVYYVLIVFRFILDDNGSDVVLMTLQASKGIAIAIFTCFLSHDVISLISCRKKTKVKARKGIKSTYLNMSRNTENTHNHELETFTLGEQKD